MIVCMSLILCLASVRADTSGTGEAYLVKVLALGAGAATSTVGVTVTLVATGTIPFETFLTGLLVVAGAGSLTTTSQMIANQDAVVQLKVDHETYLAGGAMTPMLSEVYRQVQHVTNVYTLVDPNTGTPSIDEQKMTEAIDRLARQCQAQP